jgi:hypothetical protein
MTTVTSFYAAKGGQGVTTCAAIHALSLPGRVLIVDRCGDMPAMLGMADPWPGIHQIRPDLDMWVEPDDTAGYDPTMYDHIVIDWGTELPETGRFILVTRACYLALRRWTHWREAGRPDQVVLIREPGRALTARDIEQVVGAPVHTVDYDPAIARAVDAGLLAHRAFKVLTNIT